MIGVILAILITVLLGALVLGLPWALTYLPGSREDRDWLAYVLKRTQGGWITWEVKSNEKSTNKELKGKDYSDEMVHELQVMSHSARFLRSYSLAGAKDDGFTYNKKQLANISINPWRPMHKLYKAALAQIKSGKCLPHSQEPVDIITPGLCPDGDWVKTTPPLFGLKWGEEPEWVKRKDV